MSFPGHPKSIEISRGPSFRSPKDPSRIQKEFRERVEHRQSIVPKFPGLSYDEPITAQGNSIGTNDEPLDDRGNKPSASLWIGNTSQGLRNYDLRDVFGAFGPVKSAAIKPATRYAFVNFERVEDALKAWKELNGKSIFESDHPLYIRFTASESEARQSKDAASGQKPLGAFDPGHTNQRRKTNSREEPKTTEREVERPQVAWPNGPPPKGPKFQRVDISPPPLRRGDTYRPGEEKDISAKKRSRRLGSGQRLSRQDGRRWRRSDVYQPSHIRRARSRDSSLSTSSSRRGSFSSSIGSSPRSYRDDSPYPWERPAKKEIPDVDSVALGEQVQEAKRGAQTLAASLTVRKSPIEKYHMQIIGQQNLIPSFDGEYYKPRTLTNEVQVRDQSYSPQPAVSPMQHAFGQQLPECQPQFTDSDATKFAFSLSNKRLNVEKDETASVHSDVTCSSRASLRKRKCTDCKKLGSDLSPLTPCSTCPRRFHSACGEPKPSSCTGKANFVCGRCPRLAKPAILTDTAPTVDGESSLASPPLSLTNIDQCNFTALARDNELRIDTANSSITSFFQLHTPVTLTVASIDLSVNALPAVNHATQDSRSSSQGCIPETPRQEYATIQSGSWSFEQCAQFYMQKYRIVTCQWWKRSHCRLDKEQCLYAHHDTNINPPDGKNKNRAWTCWKWMLSNTCPETEQKCLYAHENTGLYIWSDQRVSTKHITCAWWINSDSCKWAAASCRYAHTDTGVYSLDPADRRSRGSVISIERPVAYSKIPKGDTLVQRPAAGGGFVLSHPGTDPEVYRYWYQAFLSTPYTKTDSSPYAFDRLDSANIQQVNTEGPIEPDSSRNRISVHPDRLRMLEGVNGQIPMNADDDNINTEACYSPSMLSHSTNAQMVDSSMPPAGISGNSSLEAMHKPLTGLGLDPRKRRMRAASDNIATSVTVSNITEGRPVMNSSHQDVSLPPTEAESLSETATNMAPPLPSPTSKSKPHKRCEVCNKIVFKDKLCKMCKNPGERVQPNDLVLVPAEQERPKPDLGAAVSIIPGCARSIEKPMLTLQTSSSDVTQKSQQRPANVSKPMIPMKRRATNGGMFIPNKRPISNMAFSNPEQDYFGFSPNKITPAISAINSLKKLSKVNEGRSEALSLEQLTVEARLNNRKSIEQPDVYSKTPNDNEQSVSGMRQRDVSLETIINEVMRETPSRHPPGSAALTLINTGEQNAVNGDEAIAVTDNEDVAFNTDETCSQYSTDSCDSESDSPDIPYSESAELSVEYRPIITTEPWSQSTEDHDAELTSKVAIRACQECNEKHRRCTHKTMEAHPPQTKSEAKKTSPTKKQSVTGRGDSHRQVSAITGHSLPYVCALCRRHHKKCLHDEGGELDPARCAAYLSQRSGKSSDRSAAEWQGVQEAARAYADRQHVANTVSESATTDSDRSRAASSRTSVELPEDEGSKYEEIGAPPLAMEKSSEHDFEMYHDARSSPERDAHTRSPELKSKRSSAIQNCTQQYNLQHNERLRSQGVMFESDSDTDDYRSDDSQYLAPSMSFYNPLRQKPQQSRNLYDILPELHPQHRLAEQPPRYRKVSRKQEWKDLRSRQFEERRIRFGNPHHQVDRGRPESTVRALVERVMPSRTERDNLMSQMPVLQVREETISFADFLGLPRQPVACLMEDNVTLAFRDSAKDNDRVGSMTSTRGLLGRVITDEDRLPVYDK